MDTSSAQDRYHPIAASRFSFCACYTSSHGEENMKSKRKFTVVIERDEEGYYVASVPALRGCHTQAKTLDTLMKRVREVVELCLEDGNEVDDSLELVGIQQISV
jgi:predicted RNase H-like HicB family nuclease